MVTINDIAKAAKVSTATVSRVLNNDKKMSVSTETRERILDISTKLGYVPIRKRKSPRIIQTMKKNIGILMYCSQQYEWEDTYFMSIRKGIEKECNRKGLSIRKIIHLGDLGDGEMDDDNELRELDGVIFVGGPDKHEERELYELFGSYIVYVNNLSNSGEYDNVGIDYSYATHHALNYLFSLGHKQIGYIGGIEHRGQSGPEIANPRKIAFEETMVEHNLYNPSFVHLSKGFLINDGYESMKNVLKKEVVPTAFFIASDAMAIGAIRAIHEAGLNVPTDISIVSFNDIDVAQYTQPSLTTVRVYTEEMGKYAVNMLLDRFEEREIPVNVLFPSKLIVRESAVKLK
ncbi:LacI family DNA-binding transcriptional regulator [Evansella cellulosilytica]|uniref:Transcriptional regulator, LacI family n=1 Tax=Evansella cellulosilytica (strain ATCC 21833 / DSM 2522 / FERM P-1141 / JCM 9156 / N-4) TaxID=649639 RepID=E6TQZ5_EVAC2|nr:LacI family DNA-binding transcriptional regulator [Evansella cellulosilytica]ADU29371.1 transcriptional regulator, LacI family [Evansella cellulosilytica DSM 2522]